MRWQLTTPKDYHSFYKDLSVLTHRQMPEIVGTYETLEGSESNQ